MADDCLLVLCTCPNDTVAAELATVLIEQKLAACVNTVPGLRSYYRWEGNLRQGDEVLLMIKTTRVRYAELESTLKRLHPYSLAEIIATPLTAGSADYLQWIRESTTP